MSLWPVKILNKYRWIFTSTWFRTRQAKYTSKYYGILNNYCKFPITPRYSKAFKLVRRLLLWKFWPDVQVVLLLTWLLKQLWELKTVCSCDFYEIHYQMGRYKCAYQCENAGESDVKFFKWVLTFIIRVCG